MKRIILSALMALAIVPAFANTTTTLQSENACVKNPDIHYDAWWLNDCGISDKDMPQIAKTVADKRISLLVLDNNNITNNGIAILTRAASSIKDLSLNDNDRIDDVAAKYIAEKMQLYSLAIRHTYIGNEGIKAIAKIKTLNNLSVNTLDDEGAKALSERRLEILTIDQNNLTEVGMDALISNNQFRYLYMQTPRISTFSFMKFVYLLRAENVGFANGPVPTQVVIALSFNRNIKALTLENVNLNDNAAFSVAAMKNLEYLNISHNRVTSVGIEQLVKLPNLMTLKANDNNLDATSGKFLAANDRLLTVNLNDNELGDEGVAALAQAKHLLVAEVENNGITDAAMTSVAKAPSLLQINLAINEITDEGLKPFYDAAPQLRSLNLSYNDVSKAAVEDLMAKAHISIAYDGIFNIKNDIKSLDNKSTSAKDLFIERMKQMDKHQ